MHGQEGWERRSLSRLSGTLTDGTILVTPTVVEVATAQPIVAVDPHVGGSRLPTIDAQNYEGRDQRHPHLIELGHRRIGFLAGRPDLESARRREAGYRAALAEAGIEFDPRARPGRRLHRGDRSGPGAGAASLDPRPSAIFAANDLSAIQVLRTASELGLAVPADLSVVGFDNIPESALVDPPLTTVDQSIQAQGEAAVRLLIVPRSSGRSVPSTPPSRTSPCPPTWSCASPAAGSSRLISSVAAIEIVYNSPTKGESMTTNRPSRWLRSLALLGASALSPLPVATTMTRHDGATDATDATATPGAADRDLGR